MEQAALSSNRGNGSYPTTTGIPFVELGLRCGLHAAVCMCVYICTYSYIHRFAYVYIYIYTHTHVALLHSPGKTRSPGVDPDPQSGGIVNATACFAAYDACNFMSIMPYELTGAIIVNLLSRLKLWGVGFGVEGFQEFGLVGASFDDPRRVYAKVLLVWCRIMCCHAR